MVRRKEIQLGVGWNDPVRINAVVAVVIVAHDMGHVYRFGDPRHLEQLSGIGPKVRVIDDPFAVTFEMQMIDGVEPDEGGKQAPVSLGQAVTHQVAMT